jgi:RNA polymerase sigma factor (sigma-70 family)
MTASLGKVLVPGQSSDGLAAPYRGHNDPHSCYLRQGRSTPRKNSSPGRASSGRRDSPLRWATTSWTKVLAARGAPSVESRLALEALCRAYWYPLYAFVRRQGHDPEDARDLTQAYFAELLEKGYLGQFDPSLGRFRVFLMTSMKHFLSKEREKARAVKRGGRAVVISLDADVEGRLGLEPADRLTPEEIYERRWALTILERVLGKLRQEFKEEAREQEFERLKPFLTGEEPKVPYREVAAELGSSEDAVKSSVLRLRRRFGSRLREEIAETVASPEEVDEEVRHLLKSIAPWGARAS